MGTSNWQNIPFCVEALMKIAPRRVLDVGVGFGRWGIIVREFCDVWYGRVLQKDWRVHLEGIEGFPENIAAYHHHFYDKICLGDANEVLPELLKSGWHVVIFGDVLEHFTKEAGRRLLRASLEASDYVLVNIPLGDAWPQEDIYDNPYERHLSIWTAEDFEQFHLRRAGFFEDYISRPFGSFILSQADPQNLGLALFSHNTDLSRSASYNHQLTTTQRQVLAEATKTMQELERIKGTLTWQAYEAIDRSPVGPIMRRFMKVVGAPVRHRLAQRENAPVPEAPFQAPVETEPTLQPVGQVKPERFSAEEEVWAAEVAHTNPPAIAVLHPDWRGIRSATLNLFSTYCFVDDTLTEDKAASIARLLAETGVERIVFSGFPISHHHLVTALHKISPRQKLFVLWHGNFLHTQEDYAWQGFQMIKALGRQGVINKWGFVKKGMAEIIAAQTGIRTGFVMNYARQIPQQSSSPLAGGPHIGLFSVGSAWKPPYAVIAAATLIPGARLHLSGANIRVKEFLESIEFNAVELNDQAIPQEKMAEKLAHMHLNLNMSLAECTPMTPLESLAVGAPCLISATSHLFEDQAYLKERLVVPYHERPEVIAEYAHRALAERDQIIDAYRDYAPDYNQRARASLAEFLELSTGEWPPDSFEIGSGFSGINPDDPS